MAPRVSAARYTVVTLLLWLFALPGVLVIDQGEGVLVRGPWLLVAGVALMVAGAGLVFGGAGHLAARGVGLFGVAPGPVLVTDGWYGRVRNPIDLGTTLIAFGSWAVLAIEVIWVLPAAALVNFTVGVGLYEDRRLSETFGEDFDAYRRAVRKWVVRLR